MVRLKLAEFLFNFLRENGSQFHYGSIKTNWYGQPYKDWNRSQFHYGSIKTKLKVFYEVQLVSSLNSTMVRLKQEVLKALKTTNGKSQFHYGSIKTG